jgi:hypothetical protein
MIVSTTDCWGGTMRRLSGFLAVSGVVWLGGLLGLDALDGSEQTWLSTLASWGAPLVVAGTIATFLARTMKQAALCLTALWVLAVAACFVLVSIMVGASLIALNAALLYVSIPYVAWLAFPLVANAYLNDPARG